MAEREIQKLRDVLSSEDYKPDCIFNMDETALFYKTIPNRSYPLVMQDKKEGAQANVCKG